MVASLNGTERRLLSTFVNGIRMRLENSSQGPYLRKINAMFTEFYRGQTYQSLLDSCVV